MGDSVDKDGFLYKRAGSTKKSAATQKKMEGLLFQFDSRFIVLLSKC